MTSQASIEWESAYRGGRVEELEPLECRRLLVSATVGRVGFSTPEQQRIVPMNYVLHDNHVVFRTSPYSEVARCLPGRPMAFEVDDVDSFLQSGWSVLVCGTAQRLTEASLRSMDAGETPEPWVEGVRSLYLQVSLDQISGRRIHPA